MEDGNILSYQEEDNKIQIVICDKDKDFFDNFAKIIVEHAGHNKIRIEVKRVFGKEILINYLECNKVDILFLNIEESEQNVVVIGNYIRNVLKDECLFLVYISDKETYTLTLFQNRPFDFIIKPLTKKMLNMF